jgi:hypothetical protein
VKTIVTITEDLTCIITDPEVGTVSARNQQEAEAEIRRRKEVRQRAGERDVINSHREIQTGWLQ